MTLKILEASEVNGVRFPEGVKIDVHADDAKKLLESKKAELISMKIEDAINDKSEETEQVQDDKKGLEEESPSLNPEEMQDLASNEEATEASALKEDDNDTEAKGIKN